MKRLLGMRKWELGIGKWIAVGVMVVVFGGILLVRGSVQVGPARMGENADGGGGGVKFVPVDIFVDSGAKPLGAYQVEVVAKNATLVGVEGGEAKAFAEAPYYDPAALQGKRIVVASFSTDEALPNGLTRVARLHFMVNEGVAGRGLPEMTSKLVVATDAEGKTLDAKLSLRPFEGDKK